MWRQMTEDYTSSNNDQELPATERACVCVSRFKALLPERLFATAKRYGQKHATIRITIINDTRP
jgi:hypothetical protein